MPFANAERERANKNLTNELLLQLLNSVLRNRLNIQGRVDGSIEGEVLLLMHSYQFRDRTQFRKTSK